MSPTRPGSSTLFTTAAAVALTGLVLALLALNFFSSTSLHAAHRARFQLDAERSRLVLGYYASERASDLLDLAASSEVRAYFENRALGMSPEYGLNLSLVPLRARVRQLVARSQIGGAPTYTRVALVDEAGSVLADSAEDRSAGPWPAPQEWAPLLDAPGRERRWVTERLTRALVLSAPCEIDGRSLGRLVAWLDTRTVYDGLLGASAARGRVIVDMVRGVYVHDRNADADLPEPATLAHLPEGSPTELALGPAAPVLAIRFPVDGTTLSIVDMIPRDELSGRMSPWYQLGGMALLTIVVLAGVVVLQRINTQSKVLAARLDESVVRGAEIAAKSSELEREIAERLRVEEDLKKAMHAAEAGSRAKSEFLANMSHEIRTPLNGVIGAADLLHSTPLSAPQADLVDLVQTSSQTLLALIDDILDISKIEAGRLTLESVCFEPRVLANQACDIVRPRGAGRPVQVVCRIAEPVPPVLRGDPHRLRQVLLNLVGNAMKFTPEGLVEVVVDAEPEGPGAVVLDVSVRDTGIGIPAAKLDGIFNMFEQADATTTRRFGGTGLGLAICRRLVEGMGGTIWAESEPGKGSCFRFRVPLAIGLRGSLPCERTLDAPLVPSTLRILVVEDNAINQRLARAILEDAGHIVDMAENGAIAVEKVCAGGAYDVVLMDVQMPVMDGYAATAALRERGFHALPIIALTANAMKGDAEDCLARGMNDYIAKPVRRDVLLRTIEAWASRGSAPVVS